MVATLLRKLLHNLHRSGPAWGVNFKREESRRTSEKNLWINMSRSLSHSWRWGMVTAAVVRSSKRSTLYFGFINLTTALSFLPIFIRSSSIIVPNGLLPRNDPCSRSHRIATCIPIGGICGISSLSCWTSGRLSSRLHLAIHL